MQDFNAQVGLSDDAKFIEVNGGNFTATGNFSAVSVNGDECLVPKRILEGAGINANNVSFPFFVIAKKRTHKWHVDGQGNIVSNPTPDQVSAQNLTERSIVDRMTAYLIFKNEEDVTNNLTSAATSRRRIAKRVAEATESLNVQLAPSQLSSSLS